MYRSAELTDADADGMDWIVAQAGHALVGALMPEYDPVQKISIVPRGAAGGLTFFAPSEERLESGLYSKTYLENQLSVALGGRVAEEIIFGEDDVTTGASSDFMQVRALSVCHGQPSCCRARLYGRLLGALLCWSLGRSTYSAPCCRFM